MQDKYTYRSEWSEEDKEYVGLCVEFPSLSWVADSPEAALKGIARVVEDVVSDLAEEVADRVIKQHEKALGKLSDM